MAMLSHEAPLEARDKYLLTPTPLPTMTLDQLASTASSASTTELVGRQVELDRIDVALARSGVVVTLVGSPGVGKTRVAFEVACRRSTGDGCCAFVDLTGATSAREVCTALGEAIGAPTRDVDSLDEAITQIARALMRRERPLVVLDNCEHLIPQCRDLARSLIQMTSGLRLLVTSRERLMIEEELTIELAPFPVPEGGALGGRDPRSWDVIELFITRAQRIMAGWEPCSEEIEDLIAITRALEGNALAVELCAARIATLGTAEMRRQIPHRFALLRARGPLAGSRWSSLLGAIAWSWALLAPRERRALARLSVFRGGCTLEAAARLLGGDSERGDQCDVIDLLEALREKSLLRVIVPPRQAGGRRFQLYESVRELAWQRLEAMGERQEACRCHAEHFIATRHEGSSPSGAAYLYAIPSEGLIADRDNLQAIVDRALAATPRDNALALQALCAMAPLYTTRGPYAEYLAMIHSVLDGARDRNIDSRVLAETLDICALTEVKRGHFERGLRYFEEALELASHVSDRWLEAFIQIRICGTLSMLHQLEGLPMRFNRIRLILDDLRDPRLEAMLFEELCTYLFWRSTEEAERQGERALYLFRELGDELQVAYSLSQLCFSRFALGQVEDSERCAMEALEILERHGDERWVALMRTMIALVLQMRGELLPAETILIDALRVQRAVKNRWLEAFTLTLLSDLRLEMGRLADAREGYMTVIEITRPLGDWTITAWVLSGLSAVSALSGQLRESESWISEALKLADSLEIDFLSRGIELRSEHLTLARARLLATGGDRSAARRELDALRRRLDKVEGGDGASASRARRASFVLVRASLRLLRRRLEAELNFLSDGLQVAKDGSWFSVGEGAPVHLERRPRPRLLLLRLVEEQLRSSGRGVPLDELFEAGWPGERATPESAANRVYVTLTRLRKLGLGELIRSSDEGFFLDPETPVVIARERS
jgi:predicted ATPase